MVWLDTIQELGRGIVNSFKPEKIILFGSYAYGSPSEDSYVDLLVILRFQGKSSWKSLEILNKADLRFPMYLIARDPEDAERRYAQGDPLIREALDKGGCYMKDLVNEWHGKADGRMDIVAPREGRPVPLKGPRAGDGGRGRPWNYSEHRKGRNEQWRSTMRTCAD